MLKAAYMLAFTYKKYQFRNPPIFKAHQYAGVHTLTGCLQDRIGDLQRYVEALKSENSQLLAGDGTNRSMDSTGSSIRRVGIVMLGHLLSSIRRVDSYIWAFTFLHSIFNNLSVEAFELIYSLRFTDLHNVIRHNVFRPTRIVCVSLVMCTCSV